MIRAIVTTLFILCSTLTYAAVTAEVDRTQVGEGETFTLTLSSEDSSSDSPDLSILEANFDVVGTSNSKNISIINGQMSSQFSWQVQLIPKHVGSIIIPSITMGGEKTQPITIEVTAQSSPQNATPGNDNQPQGDANAFFQTTVDKKEAFVQEQIIYTQRFYYRPDLPIADISVDDLSVEGAAIESLNTKGPRYEQTINGIRYKVIEATYAVFPEKSGELRIPARALTVRMQASMFEPPRLQRLHSDENIITVLPQPTKDIPWLPAADLTIKEYWSTTPPVFKVGESVTRKITVEAEGLSQSQLPALPDVKIDGLKMYADKPETKNTVTLKGIVGSRSNNIALVASKPGTYTLPAIKINWWDTDEHQEKTATIEAFTFTVEGNTDNNGALPAPAVAQPSGAATLPSLTEDLDAHSIDRFWLFTVGGLLALWIITLLLWWRSSRKTQQRADESSHQTHTETQNSRALPKHTLAALSAACQSNDPNRGREAVLLWAKTRWVEQPPLSLEDVGMREPSLREELRNLEEALYAKQADSWQGNKLLALIKQLPPTPSKAESKKTPLESLYPPP